ncbi:MAG: bifunctional 2-polyprenyl-6-hydroxyphenol methylase/3-demethylubiquinol 3-O-methyltransferase UbiG [Alphaproteobacteria bacterium]|nr:bifunctional 2-polyprenyl-6-hydroxyphenol methylase/3-demethylubiquinol 3-O-methyltransferase UbiG [Alphaproteobacteria bacterium]
MSTQSSSVNQQEIGHFAKDAPNWWDENGPFKPLHRLNPARIGYIKEKICTHFERDAQSFTPFKKLSILDVGCGGGLVCEPMARLGADVTGADADAVAIEVAKAHAQESGLDITYENKPAEELNKKFDVVLALEIIEHVDHPEDFVQSCAKLVKPGGLVIFSTLNRTPKSFALGIVAAEYILRWVPQGTHSWKKFIKPSELSRMARAADLSPADIKGLMFNPITGDFQMSDSDIDVNYFLSATKKDT